jgi:hypothetical protein
MAPVVFAADMGVHTSRDGKKLKKDLMKIGGTYVPMLARE